MLIRKKRHLLTCGTPAVKALDQVDTHLVRVTRVVDTVVNVGLTVGAGEAQRALTRVSRCTQNGATCRPVSTRRVGTRIVRLQEY